MILFERTGDKMPHVPPRPLRVFKIYSGGMPHVTILFEHNDQQNIENNKQLEITNIEYKSVIIIIPEQISVYM